MKEISEDERLLTRAIKEYPIGTKYIPVGRNFEEISVFKARPVGTCSTGIECGRGYIYKFGRWAEIISRPTLKKLNEKNI